MKRRTFLHSISGLILWQPCWPDTATPLESTIYDYQDGGFLVSVGCLRCCLYPESKGSVLDFVPWLISRPMPEMTSERRMVPTTLLKKKLEEVGFPSVFDENESSLVAHMPCFLTPNEVADRLQQILRSGDWHLLYHDPDPDQARWDLLKFLI